MKLGVTEMFLFLPSAILYVLVVVCLVLLIKLLMKKLKSN